MRVGEDWYMGTADAIRQNLNLIDGFSGDLISVFGADHIYRMDIMQMVDFHLEKKTKVTIAALPVPISEASSFGVINVDKDWRITGFDEKPENPKCIPGRPDEALISMGNYIFDKDFLIEILTEKNHSDTRHDFGKHILPYIYQKHPIYAYDFRTNKVPGIEKESEIGYWRDVGTIKAYWEANMDLRNIRPIFNLYNREWPLKTSSYSAPPAKLVFDDKGRRGMGINSIISEGSIIEGGTVQDSVLGRNVNVKGNSAIINSILMDYVEIGEDCKINMAIIDKGVKVPDGTIIGYDLDEDRKKYFVDEESKIIVLSKGSFDTRSRDRDRY
jgi:glucose-1-phosphate adenylyltransferase